MTRTIICLRQSEASVESIFVCNVIEKLLDYGLLCSSTNDVIHLLL